MARLKSDTKKAAIVKAATELFAEKGYFYTNVKEIADKAELSVGSVYNYFKNKDDILVSLFMEFFQTMIKDVELLMKKDIHPLEKYSKGIEIVVEHLSKNMDMARVFLVELHQSATSVMFLDPIIKKKHLEFVKKLLEEGEKKKMIIPGVDPEIVTLISNGIIEEFTFDWVQKKYSKEELLRKIDLACKYSIYGIAQKEEGLS